MLDLDLPFAVPPEISIFWKLPNNTTTAKQQLVLTGLFNYHYARPKECPHDRQFFGNLRQSNGDRIVAGQRVNRARVKRRVTKQPQV